MAVGRPLLLFLLWLWVDFFAALSPLPWYWVDVLLAAALLLVFLVPVGWAAYRLVTAAPRLFQNAGWDVQPLEPVREEEMYTVRYTFRGRRRAPNTFRRQWLRAAQGWVYIEIAVIFIAAILMVPVFFSALDFGFGR